MIHGAMVTKSRPSETIDPHAGLGGGTPAPKKLNIDSERITEPTNKVESTITVLRTPGNKCLANILVGEAPVIFAIKT